jgi:hypothetical protein
MKLSIATSTLPLFALLLATACGDDSGEPSSVDGFDPRLRGIYSLELHSKNEAACEPSAESLPDQHPLFVIDTIDFRGQYLLGALSCADLATCRSHIEQAQAPGPDDVIPELDVKFFFMFTNSRSDGSAWVQASGTNALGDMCTAEIFSDQLVHADGLVRIESRIIRVPGFAIGQDGVCRIPDEARSIPCTAFELVSGTLSQPL